MLVLSDFDELEADAFVCAATATARDRIADSDSMIVSLFRSSVINFFASDRSSSVIYPSSAHDEKCPATRAAVIKPVDGECCAL